MKNSLSGSPLGVRFPPAVEEEVPMTMQVGMVADGGIVLASDTKSRSTERYMTCDPDSIPMDTLNYSKISFCNKHDIAIAISGMGEIGTDPGGELADHLSTFPSIAEDEIETFLTAWGNQYFLKTFPDAHPGIPRLVFLVVNPRSRYPLRKLRVQKMSNTSRSTTFMVNGHTNNSAIFWLDYFECADRVHPTRQASAIAALAIQMGKKIHPYGIGGLEVWEYAQEWTALTAEEIASASLRFQRLTQFLTHLIESSSTTP